jgi:hypothetical protein
MTNWATSNIKNISITNGGRRVVITIKEGFQKDCSVPLPVASATIDGKYVRMKGLDGRTWYKWNTVTGTLESGG